MSDVDDGEPIVRPLEPTGEGEPRTRHAAAGVVAVAVAGIAALVFFAGPDRGSGAATESTTTTRVAFGGSTVTSEPVPTSAPLASTSSTTTTAVSEPALRDLLPNIDGALITAITTQSESGLELVRWPPATSRRSSEIPMLGGPFLEFDESDQHMAFLGPSATVEGPTLYVGRSESWAPARVGVSSFRWHATLPGRIGWREPGDPTRICWADADASEGLSSAVCVPGSGNELVGFDSAGFLVVDYTSRTVARLDVTGKQVGGVSGTDALIGPDGRVLIVDQSPDASESSFALVDPDLTKAVDLDWAPLHPSGAYGFVAWSPVGHSPELAFLVFDQGERTPQLQLWNLDGTLRQTVNLSGRVWDVAWNSTGRYLLIPGVLDESDHVLQVYDTFSRALVSLPFDNWIQHASLVTPAVCEDAAHVVAAFADRLPTGVSLESSQMVLSRDAFLESWYFTSARIVGGPYDGELASWALPGFDHRTAISTINTPNQSVPLNQAASSLGFGMALDPSDYGVDNWLHLDGALASQICVQEFDQQPG